MFSVASRTFFIVCLLQLICELDPAVANDSNHSATFIIPCGTKIAFVLQDAINSKYAKDGDQFLCRTKENITIDGKICVAEGALITGHLTKVQHLKREFCTVVFDRLILSNGQPTAISAYMDNHGRLAVTRDGQQIAYDCPTRMGCVNYLSSVPQNIESYNYDATTIVGPPKSAPIELKANDELTLELSENIRH
jgi:hypothetical protein